MSVNGSTPPATLVDDASYQSFDNALREFSPPTNVKSPYTDTQIISIDVGKRQTRFRIHDTILKQSPELHTKSALKLWGEKTISLPDLDEETAHTLVHYLYTGCYDTLESQHDDNARSALAQYKLGTCAYCAAIRYKLPGLAELAKKIMVGLQDELTIFDVLVVARDHAFPGLPEDEAWFSGYLEDAIHAARTRDADLFTRPDFVDQIKGDLRYRQVVMKAIVNSYAQASLSASVSVAETPKEVEKAQVGQPELGAAAVPVLDEITPTLEAHVAPEPYMDELGWERSKTFQQQSQKAGIQDAVAEKSVARPGHARVDSLLGVKEDIAPVSAATSSDKAKIVPVGDVVDAKGAPNTPAAVETKDVQGESAGTSPVEAVDEFAGLSKSQKKKLIAKKKKEAEAAAAASGKSAAGTVAVAAN